MSMPTAGHTESPHLPIQSQQCQAWSQNREINTKGRLDACQMHATDDRAESNAHDVGPQGQLDVEQDEPPVLHGL